MKTNTKLFYSIFLLSLIAFLSSFVQQSSSNNAKIKKGKFTINKIHVNANWNLTDFKSALSGTCREKNGYNKTHTYDDKGIVVFESMSNKVPTGIVSEIQFYLQAATETNDVVPNGIYTDELKIDKLAIDKNVTSQKMLKSLKKWKKTDSYMENSYRMSKSGIYIYFQFAKDENSLIKVSIGKDKS